MSPVTTAKDDADEHVVVRPVGASPGRDAEFTAFVLDHRATLLRAAWLLVGDAHRAEDEIVGHAGSHQDADRAGDRDRLDRALATLTEKQRRIVVLRYLMDPSEADVADDLDVSIGTVKSTASRALADLRVALGSRYADLEGGAR